MTYSLEYKALKFVIPSLSKDQPKIYYKVLRQALRRSLLDNMIDLN